MLGDTLIAFRHLPGLGHRLRIAACIDGSHLAGHLTAGLGYLRTDVPGGHVVGDALLRCGHLVDGLG
jgi:hypothetical protein